MSNCGRCAGHGTIQGIRFGMESGPVESYKEPCPQTAADSVVFPTLAFGGFDPLVTTFQFIAKVAGGLFWSLVLNRRRKRAAVGG